MKRLLVLLGAIVLADTLFYSTLSPLLPHYKDVAGLSKSGAGLLTAAFGAGTLIGSIPAGVLATRAGVKRTILLGLTLLATTSLAFGFAHQVWLLDLARLAQGFAAACTWTATLSWLVSIAPAERRGELIGSVLGLAIGGALFGPALGALAAHVGTGWVFGGIGLLIGALAAVVASTETPSRGESRPLRALASQLGRGEAVAGMWLIALPAALFGMVSVLAPLRLDRLGWGATAIGAAFLLSAAGEAVLSPIVGRLWDRLGPSLLIGPAIAASAAVTFLLPLPHWAWAVGALVVASGMAYGVFWVPAMASLSHSAEAGGHDQSFAFALINLAWAAGQTSGSTAAGTAGHAFGDRVPYWVGAGLCLLTLAVLGLTRGALAAYSEAR